MTQRPIATFRTAEKPQGFAIIRKQSVHQIDGQCVPMWSRQFLWTGLTSGIAVAALTLSELWLAVFVVSGSKNPTVSFANMVLFALPGLIVYSACWYMIIYRRRDYSLYRTMALVLQLSVRSVLSSPHL
jgi:hypothetical protein